MAPLLLVFFAKLLPMKERWSELDTACRCAIRALLRNIALAIAPARARRNEANLAIRVTFKQDLSLGFKQYEK